MTSESEASRKTRQPPAEALRLRPRVPDTFLVAEVAGAIVGRTSIRHELNDFLSRLGGHIGYCVLPGYRRHGYATEILRQSLLIIVRGYRR